MIRVESFGVVPFRRDESGQIEVLLILHRKGKHWGFPKGKPNPQETPLESASRELKEETGLDIAHFVSKDPITEEYHFRHKGQKVIKVVHYFPAFVKGVLQIQAEEVTEAKWQTIDQAFQQLTFAEARQILVSCLDKIAKLA